MGNRKNYDGWDLADLLREELVGQRITTITDDLIVLDNGTVLDIEPNQGCGDCDTGWAEMEIIPNNPNTEAAVMNVEYEDTYKARTDSFKIFIYMANSTITMKGFNGNDNGYYGSGFWVTVTR